MSATLITRADDFGSSLAANAAILEAQKAGFIRNVSLMAVGPFIEDGAEALKQGRDICLGMHAVLNSEWEEVKWVPASPKGEIPSLLDSDGEFYSRPSLFPKSFRIEEALKEYNAQLDKLTRLGFPISYVDSHMFAERDVDGLAEAFSQWTAQKGLIDHKWFYRGFPMDLSEAPLAQRLGRALAGIGEEGGQYLHIFHPAYPTEEMLHYYHEGSPAPTVQQRRGEEYRFVTAPETLSLCEKCGVRPIRYDEAAPLAEA